MKTDLLYCLRTFLVFGRHRDILSCRSLVEIVLTGNFRSSDEKNTVQLFTFAIFSAYFLKCEGRNCEIVEGTLVLTTFKV